MNPDRLIADAKKELLALVASGYVQPQMRTDILALGNPALATLKLGVHLMKRAGYISDHDALIGEKLARVLTGASLVFCPRPRGRSGCVTTATTEWRERSSASSVGTANSGVPKNTTRSGSPLTFCRRATACGFCGR